MRSLLRPARAPLAVEVRRRLARLRRDLSVVLGDLRGEHPSPLVTRPPRRYPAPAAPTDGAEEPGLAGPRSSAAAARRLVVTALHRQTADATTITLADPAGAPLRFVPGQFLTLLVELDGEVLRRAYSICSHLDDDRALAVTVKRIPGGRVSTHLHERLAVGDALGVLGPSGEFTVDVDPAAAPPPRRSLVLIAGGSGITPMMAILRAVLAHEPASEVTLLYGSRAAADVIFADELDALAARHPDRLVVRHVLEQPGGRPATVGRLDRATVAAELDAVAARCGGDTRYYVCGPAAAMEAAVDALRARGVPPERLRQERFASPGRRAAGRATAPLALRVVGRGGEVATVDALVAPGASVLDAGLAAGVDMPFSCAMGGCGACAVRLVDGEVELDEPNCLSPQERAAGRILACVARPAGPCTVEVRR